MRKEIKSYIFDVAGRNKRGSLKDRKLFATKIFLENIQIRCLKIHENCERRVRGASFSKETQTTDSEGKQKERKSDKLKGCEEKDLLHPQQRRKRIFPFHTNTHAHH